MKSNHYTPIVTNARQGLPVSTLNQRRTSPAMRAGIIMAVLVAFWGGAALLLACIA